MMIDIFIETKSMELSAVQLFVKNLFEFIINKTMTPPHKRHKKSCNKLRNHHVDINLNLGVTKRKNQIFTLKIVIEVLAIKTHSK